ncbi:MAG: chlorite dismutase family protein [Acidobacteria bacterium]|nr:chlorite dismutase family protein [Acidobacteriota bacterium]
MSAAPPIYSLFACASDAQAMTSIDAPKDGRVNRYRIDSVQAITGMLEPLPLAGWPLIRVEGSAPREAPDGVAAYYGVTQHVQYTTAEQAAALAKSRGEYGASGESIRAVMIPIRKTEAWWGLPHDERQAHFREGERPGHTRIGEPYVDRVFRRLYHSRYLGRKVTYDFLTYFEFERKDEAAFRELLRNLRDAGGNPEWRHVDMECEIWMTKLG